MAEPIELRRAKNRDRMRTYRAAHPERASEQLRAWRAANPDKVAATRERFKRERPNYWREWREANAEREKETKAAWRAANPETWRASTKAYREANAERQREIIRAWLAANPGKPAEWSAARRARLLGVRVEKIDREAIIARDKQRCHLCRKKVAKAQIELDHLVPLAEGGDHVPENLAVSHRRCNRSKGVSARNEQLRVVG